MALLICPVCGITLRLPPSTLKNRRTCSIKCRNTTYAGAGNPKWRGGRVSDHGRVMIYAPDHPNATLLGGTYIYEYRLIASQKIGRALLPSEIVHHINGDYTDNRPENLQVMTQSQHAREHNFGRANRGRV